MTVAEYKSNATLWANSAMRFAVRVCGSHADSQDAVQDALVSLWEHRDDVEAAHGMSYLFSATYRRLASAFRRAAVERRHAAEVEQPRSVLPDSAFELHEAINAALQSLPEVQRAALQLRDVEGFSYREVAQTLGLSADQVQVYIFRARVAMRKKLKEMGYDRD